MKLRATKTHCEGTGHLPHSAQVPDHLQAVQLPVKGQLALAHPTPSPSGSSVSSSGKWSTTGMLWDGTGDQLTSHQEGTHLTWVLLPPTP